MEEFTIISQDPTMFPEISANLNKDEGYIEISHNNIITGESVTVRHIEKKNAIMLANWIIENAQKL